MATTQVETVPCSSCGRETYSKPDDDDGMVYCSETDMPVLVCDATPLWKEAPEDLAAAQAKADAKEAKAQARTEAANKADAAK